MFYSIEGWNVRYFCLNVRFVEQPVRYSVKRQSGHMNKEFRNLFVENSSIILFIERCLLLKSYSTQYVFGYRRHSVDQPYVLFHFISNKQQRARRPLKCC